jgi:Flp pilus assembly protein TadD
VAAGLAILGFLLLAGSLRRVPADGATTILDSRLLPAEPRILAPGWHVVPPLLFRSSAYPARPERLEFRLPGHDGPLRSSEGIPVEVRGRVHYRVPPHSAITAHRNSRGDFRGGLIEPSLRRELREIVRHASFSRISGAHRYELESAAAARLGPVVRATGGELVSLEIDAVRMAPVDGAGWSLEPIPGARLLVIGLDGAEWRVVDALMEQGKLPNLSRLVAKGVRARLRTIDPILSPVVWTTVATGFLPDRHGVLDFLVTDTRTGAKVPVTSRQRKVRAVWNLLNDAGLRVGVIGWWATWPAEEVDGYIVTDRTTAQFPGLSRESRGNPAGKTFPPELFGKIEPLLIPPEAVGDAEIAPFLRIDPAGETWRARSENRVAEFRSVLASTRATEGVALALGSGGFAPFQAVYFEGIDTVSHLFMPFRPPRREGISEEDYRRFARAVDAFYAYQDEVVGRLLERAGEGTGVLILSDHGFRSEADRPYRESRIEYATAALWHRKHGILVASGGPFRQGVTLPEVSVVDITPTILAYFGLPSGEDMAGRPVRDLFTPEFLDRHPPAYRPSWERGGERAVAEVSDPEADRALKEKLLALGYLSQEGGLPHNNLGNALLARGDASGALREFRLAVEQAPRSGLVRVNLARTLIRLKDREAARRELEEALRFEPGFPEARVLLASLDIAEGKTGEAERRLREVIRDEPSSADAHRALGLLHYRRGETREAIESYRRAIDLEPDDAEAYNNLGIVLRDLGRPEEAEAVFREAIEAEPGMSASYNNLALIQMDRGDYDAAEEQLRRALDLSPEDPSVHNNLGNLLVHRGRLDEAEAAYRRALELRPAAAEPHNGLAAIRGRRGDRAGEIAGYRMALEQDPSYADARMNLAGALVQDGKPGDAEAEYRRVLASEPARWSAAVDLGRLLIREGRPREAVEVCREAVERVPPCVACRNLLGEALLAAGDRNGARSAFESSLRIRPEQAEIRRRLEGIGSVGGP